MSEPAAPPSQPRPIRVRVVETLRDVAAADWDAVACPAVACPAVAEAAHAESDSQEDHANPFISHAFLSALEQSDSAVARTGWSGAHVLIEDEQGRLEACAPCYLKPHSMGEYVFDHGWADAYERAGGSYYPKLQVCVPFTPATGRRLLTGSEQPGGPLTTALVAGLRAVGERTGASSTHITFATRAEWEAAGSLGLLQRTDQQFHWLNRAYATYDDFLAGLASRKRKALKRERREALANGITIERLTGAAITERHWDDFYAFYMDTGARKWGRPYLTRAFFSLVSERMADRILLVMARRDGRYIAGAINFIGANALYGRNWGCIEDHPFLHFEVCYHQAIDFAIERGLARVEAGAQGEHKLARGYEPVTTHSMHDIADPALRRAVADFLVRERRAVERMADALGEATPFRKGPGSEPERDA